MTDYVVGDVQGCLQPLLRLLSKINFDPTFDRLISAGDLVNRGPQSLQTLRYCKALGSSFTMVLGNHDLHLLAVARGVKKPTSKDTIHDILAAPDANQLIQWLQQHPLLLQIGKYTIVHAGIPPQWTLKDATNYSTEVHDILRSENADSYFKHMYGNQPDRWTDDLQGGERLRIITNYLTRMRFCTDKGNLDLDTKNTLIAPSGLQPWFEYPNRKTMKNNLIFGHWASLEGRYCGERLFPLDTGCVWGGPLRAMNLDTGTYIESM